MLSIATNLAPHKLGWYTYSSNNEVPKPDIAGTVYDAYPLNLRFIPDWFKQVRIEWEVPDEWKPYSPRFVVFMSESEQGPFRQLNEEPQEEPYFVAYETEVSAKFRNEFWMIQAHLDNGDIYRTTPETITQRIPRFQYIRYLEIIRREHILLDRYVGVDSIIFRRREYGPRCKHCWDFKEEKVVNDNCPHCFGTSYEGGYYRGILTKVQYDSTTDRKQYTYFGKFEPHQLVGWTLNYPTINVHDIVIRLSDYHAYRVEALQNTEMMTRPLRQIMQLTELPRVAIEQELLRRKDWEVGPIRVKHEHHVHDIGN